MFYIKLKSHPDGWLFVIAANAEYDYTKIIIIIPY